MKKTLHLYLFREIAAPFAMGLAVFTLVLLMGRLLKLADLVVGNGVALADVLLLLLYLAPSFCLVTIPMAFLLSVLLAFGRLSSDGEITAMKSSGVGIRGLLPPVFVFALLAWGATTFMTVSALPMGQRAFRALMQEIVEAKSRLNLKEGVFNDQFPGIVLFVNRFSPDTGQVGGVIVHDERDGEEESTIFAAAGEIARDPAAGGMRLRLRNGTIHRPMPQGGYRLASFDTYDLTMSLPKPPEKNEVDERGMTFGELAKNMHLPHPPKVQTDIALEFHRRFSLPFACFLFAAAGVPLGIRNRRSGKSAGFSASIGVILVYYILLSAGTRLGERHLVPAWLAMWLPNLLLIPLALHLLRRAAADREGWGLPSFPLPLRRKQS